MVFVLVSSIGVYGEKIFLTTVFVSPDIAIAAKQFVTIFRSDLGKTVVLYFSLIRWQSFTTGSNKTHSVQQCKLKDPESTLAVSKVSEHDRALTSRPLVHRL